jgi:hypothetical protein
MPETLPLEPVPPNDRPKRRTSRLFPALAVAGGAVLALFEVGQIRGGAGGEVWFWMAVAALMIVLGLFGLFDKPPAE